MPPRSSQSSSKRSARSSDRRDAARVSPLADGLLRACDGGILAMLFVAPLFMGGRHPLGQLVAALVALATAALWLARQAVLRDGGWIRTGCEWLLLAGFAVLLLQLAPLPESLLAKISPALTQQFPLWFSHSDASFQLGSLGQASLTPDWTREGLALYLGYALFFWVVAQRLRTLDERGIDIQVLSHQGGWWYGTDRDLAGRLIKIQNERLAAWCTANKDRFVGLASVALQWCGVASDR